MTYSNDPLPACACCGKPATDPQGEWPWPCACVDANWCALCLRCYGHCECDNPVDLSGIIRTFWRENNA